MRWNARPNTKTTESSSRLSNYLTSLLSKMEKANSLHPPYAPWLEPGTKKIQFKAA